MQILVNHLYQWWCYDQVHLCIFLLHTQQGNSIHVLFITNTVFDVSLKLLRGNPKFSSMLLWSFLRNHLRKDIRTLLHKLMVDTVLMSVLVWAILIVQKQGFAYLLQTTTFYCVSWRIHSGCLPLEWKPISFVRNFQKVEARKLLSSYLTFRPLLSLSPQQFLCL